MVNLRSSFMVNNYVMCVSSSPEAYAARHHDEDHPSPTPDSPNSQQSKNRRDKERQRAKLEAGGVGRERRASSDMSLSPVQPQSSPPSGTDDANDSALGSRSPGNKSPVIKSPGNVSVPCGFIPLPSPSKAPGDKQGPRPLPQSQPVAFRLMETSDGLRRTDARSSSSGSLLDVARPPQNGRLAGRSVPRLKSPTTHSR